MPMPKHGSTIDVLTVANGSVTRLGGNLTFSAAGTWAEFPFVDVVTSSKATPDDVYLSAIINNSFDVDHLVVNSLTARLKVPDRKGKPKYTFYGWSNLHIQLTGGDPKPPGFSSSPAGAAAGVLDVLEVNGYFRAVAVYTY